MSIFETTLEIRFWSLIILFSIGVPAACLNAVAFAGIKIFRRSSSAHYVAGQSLADANVFIIVFLQIIPSKSLSISSIACKFMVFSVQMTMSVAMSFFCLSAFDRWACTSQTVRIRQLRLIQVVRRLFPVPFILWSLVNIPFLIYCDLIPPTLACWFTHDLFM
ncbi:unnamed protein product [Rotaria magnacalcarata]|uniref:Uncharacterized protein n=1 Tax=Rotaria magnacalcarata TaxID=392030 RepID=A0A820BJQ8_9BILA|nr:unnamed protein product [Rotaria magnacalcarata]CAF1389751.1 unnamed protein product [Rotaria magnacalcarata]CAF2053832.1 unnamed protein product [Rotaria magnacalcarata]CAF2129335.1 unnamed protein product [Rotaria magnacalcarata]CAF2179948.1 unnamed protein product [Rotaria magnacalcarata]